MKRTITVYGLIAGAIVSVLMVIGIRLMSSRPDSEGYGMIIGFSSMLLAFSFIFVAIKSYRDKEAGGVVSFGRAFSIGLLVAVIASLCYTITWVIVYKNFYPNFLDNMFDRQLASMRQSGKSAAEIARAAKEMEGTKAVYATWYGLVGYTLAEILPLGIVVALVSALILKRRTPKAAEQVVAA